MGLGTATERRLSMGSSINLGLRGLTAVVLLAATGAGCSTVRWEMLRWSYWRPHHMLGDAEEVRSGETTVAKEEDKLPVENLTQAEGAAASLPTNSSPEARIVRPGVSLNIVVLVAKKPEVDVKNKRVTEQGDINLPLVGNVIVSGLSRMAVEARLRRHYSDYFITPEVTVEFAGGEEKSSDSPWGQVTVSGRVAHPGLISLPATLDMSVSQAIVQAGGLATSARSRSVKVTRRLPDGSTKTWVIDVHAILNGEGGDSDLRLEPGDTIFVPESIF